MNKESRIQVGGKTLIAKTGHMARQAHAAVTLQYGETLILVTVCRAEEAAEGQDFFPLTVEYTEKTYAGGVIPGGWFKREGKASEKEILTARLTDRPIRPLFPESYLNEVQIVATVLSSDGENNPDIMSINGASLALILSDVPFLEPVAAVRIAEVDGKFVVNPTYAELQNMTLDLVVAGTRAGITMIESEASEVSEERIIEALEFAHQNIIRLIDFQEEFAEGLAKPKMKVVEPAERSQLRDVIEACRSRVQAINRKPQSKESRDQAFRELTKEFQAQYANEEKEISSDDVAKVIHDVEYEEVRHYYLKDRKRVDGRGLEEIRSIACEVGLLPRTHGSSLFTRGQTQSLGIVTLGSSRDEQIIESYEGRQTRNFMLHYNFPPFSVGEVKSMRGPGRREIGHGNLALRGLKAVMPTKEAFPYTIRLVSEILESNGSSSMASICSGSLALMDAGVPLKGAVSGIAMGLIKEDKDYVVLSDIAGVEDHLGDMDFKVAGTSRGITTLQLDIKLKEGLDFAILRNALDQAKRGRAFILEKMLTVIKEARPDVSQYAPRIYTIKVDPEKLGEIIGPGGKMIRKISQESECEIEIQDDGTVRISSKSYTGSKKAEKMINDIVRDPEVGDTFKCTVKRIMNFGAFCEFLPGREALVHVSELSHGYVNNVDDLVKLGDEFEVKVIDIDQQGRIVLSRKAMMPDHRTPEEIEQERESRAQRSFQRSDRPSQGRSGGGRDGRHEGRHGGHSRHSSRRS